MQVPFSLALPEGHETSVQKCVRMVADRRVVARCSLVRGFLLRSWGIAVEGSWCLASSRHLVQGVDPGGCWIQFSKAAGQWRVPQL